ncbi:MAG: RNA polymerase sigma factor [Proteobacteria bacterium]|nr:RNA polymerase sigma factor [Pseudomonadota bacterium]
MTNTPRERDDAALVAAILGGDGRSFSELMGRHKDGLYRLIRRYVGDDDEAYDLLQETFASAWNAMRDFDANKPIIGWLRRIALNKCRDWSRRRKVRRFFYGARALESSLNIETPAVENNEPALARLDIAIASLPAALKEPLLLTQIEGLSHKEAAELLNLSPKAIEVRVYRAKRALEAALSGT